MMPSPKNNHLAMLTVPILVALLNLQLHYSSAQNIQGCRSVSKPQSIDGSCPKFNFPPTIASKNYYVFNLHRMTWYRANHHCVMHGMKMATVQTKQEHEELLDLIHRNGISDVWFGLTDLGYEGWFYHITDGSFLNNTFWLPGEPTNKDGEHCARYQKVNGLVSWADDKCDANNFVACDLRL